MAYCRFSEGDVYLIPTGGTTSAKGWSCMACRLQEGHTVDFSRAVDAWDHLLEHRRAGHLVPDHAFVRLQPEANAEEDAMEREASL